MVLPALLLLAQAVFPSDGTDAATADAELMAAVCPGGRCKIPCPKDAGLPGGDWTVERVTRGHFLTPTSDDAAVAMSGCEPHTYNFGGTKLLTRTSGRWQTLWYKAGIPTEQCHKIAHRDGRDVLVCLGTFSMQGWSWTDLYIEDLLKPHGALMAGMNDSAFFQVLDTTKNCGWDPGGGAAPMKRAAIQQVEFAPSSSNGSASLTVTAEFGKAQLTAQEVAGCKKDPSQHTPPAKTYRIDFLFDGQTFRVAPSSTAAAQIFAANR